MKLFWDLEVLGIRLTENDVEEMVIKHFKETRSIENKRHVVSWPWKSENPRLPSLYHMSLRRLEKEFIRCLKNEM